MHGCAGFPLGRRRRLGLLAPAAVGMLLAVAACSGEDLVSAIESAREGAELQSGQAREEGKMRLTSTAFEPGAEIPRRFTCDGRDVSPPLALYDVPPEARSLVLVLDDPDAPGGTWDHWVAYDIPVTNDVQESAASLGTAGRNSWGRTGYGGPCPPRGTHRYVFAVYALDTTLGLEAGAGKSRVLDAIRGHVLAEARLTGRYARSGG